ncbi:MAG: hypothetical protein ABSE61_27660 [Bradyrhizobium sp.]|jgi:hypothetical protein
MREMSQLATAMLAVVFAAVMLIAGQLFLKSRPETAFIIPAAQALPSRFPDAPGTKHSLPPQFSRNDQHR